MKIFSFEKEIIILASGSLGKNKNGRSAFMQKIGKKFYYDMILILVLLILALSVFIIMRLTREDGAYAVVSIDGEDIGRYSLSVDGEFSLNGGSNVLVISEGRAYMKDADCPDKVCVHSGKISYVGERILCLPNKIEVYVVGSDDGIL